MPHLDVDTLAARFGLPDDVREQLRALVAAGTTLVAGDTLALDEVTDPVVLPRLEAEPPVRGPRQASTGRYEDQGLIGMGGMGEVRRVRDRELNRVLAMKIIRPELMRARHVLARFIEEAQATAQLEHPGIVPVHEMGRLPDGRFYFTMKEVRGKTLTDAIGEVHAASDTRSWGTGESGWSFPRLVDAFRRVCEAVAHAHARGVIHRDLKPDNIMVGAYGEILVLDWGIAKIVGRLDPVPAEELMPVETDRSRDAAFQTRVGTVTGTPIYMAPEQARGEIDRLDAHADVYALGAILYEVLSGRPPYDGEDARDVLRKVIEGPPTRPPGGSGPAPEELIALCERAMARDPAVRFADAGAVAQELVRWQEGARKRERALTIVADAQERLPRLDVLRERAAECRTEARRLGDGSKPWDPVEKKREVWRVEDEARRLASEADLAELEIVTLLQGALTHAPDLPEAHQLLAQHYRDRHAHAERSHDEAAARRFEVLLAAHDDGTHAAYREGTGHLTLQTDPPGAIVELYRYQTEDRRLVPVYEGSLGTTPLDAVPLPMGRYLLLLHAEGCLPVRYPVHIRRELHWAGVRPGDHEPHPIHLPRPGELAPDDVYVPAGWTVAGGDPKAGTSLSRRELWVDGFVMKRFPVTNADYLAFLNALVAEGQEELALACAPRERAGGSEQGALIYGRDASGRFRLRIDADGDAWDPLYPVLMIDWHGANAYARWLARATGLPWRLAGEYEWEKAARGVDERFHPWGNHVDATWACLRTSRPGRPLPARVTEFELDESPYGVRGLGGNASELCADAYLEDGPPIVGGIATIGRATSRSALRVNRGGAWSYFVGAARVAQRRNADPSFRAETLGLRVVRSLG